MDCILPASMNPRKEGIENIQVRKACHCGYRSNNHQKKTRGPVNLFLSFPSDQKLPRAYGGRHRRRQRQGRVVNSCEASYARFVNGNRSLSSLNTDSALIGGPKIKLWP